MNKKGLTIIELIITIALVSVIMIFLYKLLATISFESDSEYLDITDRTTRSEIIRTIEDAIIDYNTDESHTKKILVPGFSSQTIYLCTEDVAAGSCNNSKAYFTIKLKQNTVKGKSVTNELVFSNKTGIIESWQLKKGTFQTLNNEVCTTPSIGSSDIKILKCHIEVYTKNINNKQITNGAKVINNNNTLDDIEISITEFNISKAPIPEEEGAGGGGPVVKTCADYNLNDYTWSEIITMYNEKISGTYSDDEHEAIMNCITSTANRGLSNLQKKVVIGGNEYNTRIINATPCNGSLATNSSCGLIFKFTDPYRASFKMYNSASAVGYSSSLAYTELNNITNASGTAGGSDVLNPISTKIAFNTEPVFGTAFNFGRATNVKYYIASPVETGNRCNINIINQKNSFCNLSSYCTIYPSDEFCSKTITGIFDNLIQNETFGWFRDYYKDNKYYYNSGSTYNAAAVTSTQGLYPIFRLAN